MNRVIHHLSFIIHHFIKIAAKLQELMDFGRWISDFGMQIKIFKIRAFRNPHSKIENVFNFVKGLRFDFRFCHSVRNLLRCAFPTE
jgi:hypothetical protein